MSKQDEYWSHFMKIESTPIQEAYKMLQDKFRQRQQEFKRNMAKDEHNKLLQDIERLRQIRAKEIIREYIQTYSRKAIISTHFFNDRR